MSAVPELWIARHGETEWSRERKHTGVTDLPLTEAGERAARERLGPQLAGERFDLVLSSPLRRALETARLAGFEPELDDRLREMDYGEYEGLTTAQIHEGRRDWDLWTDGNPGGESVADVAARVDRLLEERVRAPGIERALLFGHGHTLRILAARWLGLDGREGRVFILAAGALGVMGSEHERPAIERWGA